MLVTFTYRHWKKLNKKKNSHTIKYTAIYSGD